MATQKSTKTKYQAKSKKENQASQNLETDEVKAEKGLPDVDFKKFLGCGG
jgi:hypothetical protein